MVRNEPIDDMAHLHMMTYGMDRTTFVIELHVQVIRQTVEPVSPTGLEALLPILAQRSKTQLWNFLAEGHYIPRPAPVG